MNKNNYIIGYGSLINFESQNITGVSHWSKPIRLKNHSRSWTVAYDDLQFCAVGIYKNPGRCINAVLFSVESIEVFDQREHGYYRSEVEQNDIQMWHSHDEIPIDGSIWVYYPLDEKKNFASQNHFIWQSYLDVIMMGCLSISEEYAIEFIKSTQQYNKNFVKNDRLDSKYIRALKQYDAMAIDQILKLIK